MASTNAIFCGNGSLLIQCALAFLDNGGAIDGVITDDRSVTRWANANNYELLGTPHDPAVGNREFDYLFSVANVTVLPTELITKPNRLAINFHDGPLPDRVGLNVPAWALLEGADTHAITWHVMTETVDGGDALISREIPIKPSDSAFSLNAACFEAGLETFRELCTDLFADTLTFTPLVGERTVYLRAKRPEHLGVVNFVETTAQIDRLVRALDFGGGYANPITSAKLWTGQDMLTFESHEVLDLAGEPGQVLESSGDALVIACADGALRFSGVRPLHQTSDSESTTIDLGASLTTVPVNVENIEASAASAIGRAEVAWQEALRSATPALPPYPRTTSPNPSPTATDLVPGPTTIVDLAASFAAWVAGLAGLERVSIGVYHASDHVALSPVRLVSQTYVATDHVDGLRADFVAQHAVATERAPMQVDLAHRIVEDDARLRAQQAVSVVVASTASDLDNLANVELALLADDGRLVAPAGAWDDWVLQAMASDFAVFHAEFSKGGAIAAADLPLGRTNSGDREPSDFDATEVIHGAIATMVDAHPDHVALEAGDVTLTYAELDSRAEALARALVERGAAPGQVVGLLAPRSAELIVSMLAILKSGSAYLPLDPTYPADRIAYMIDDADARLIITTPPLATEFDLDADRVVSSRDTAIGGGDERAAASSDDLAYLIYTSGSTGRPKGVMVPHKTVINFFVGMDEMVPLDEQARLLGVTSISFDISVLEILWILARGRTLVFQTDDVDEPGSRPDFSLFYFASEDAGAGTDAYNLLIEGARYGDANGFSAVWTPERHFHPFGGLYPNPAIAAAALTGVTNNIKLRAGSSVLPLHHPVRVAEDWALVDNLSNGRAGMAIASGWQPNDFVVRPQSFANRKGEMLEGIKTMRRLWAGEKVEFDGHDGVPVATGIHPRPVQDEMPLWLTAAGNPETFAAAAELGCGVLTHLLGQTFEEVAQKISDYRAAWRKAGHPGSGHVVLMLHTFVGDSEEAVKEIARGPMKQYLGSAVDLVKQAAWTFPTIVDRATDRGVSPQEMFEAEELSPEDLDQLLEHAFERYYQNAGLFGTPATATEIARKLIDMGVDEIGCLIDFGIDADTVLENLPNIRKVMDRLEQTTTVARKATVAEDILDRNVTHLQCTPSMATMLAEDEMGKHALSKLDVMMVGGEALKLNLAESLRASLGGTFLNMYGPTETTIWSTVATLDQIGTRVPLGLPIANTQLSIRSIAGRALPPLVEGELWIGGDGVTKGYWNRPDLTKERFVETGDGTFYRTGDLVRFGADGTLEFLGRIDNQVKIRGHRIELGEIESVLAAQAEVRDVAVKAVEFGANDIRLVGYVTPARGQVDADGLKNSLAEALPDFMVPSLIHVLDDMPLTSNGKIDMNALPSNLTAVDDGPVEAAEGDAEATIAEIWRTSLGLDEISVTRNFFDLGGHSLLVVEVQRLMREALSTDVSITDLFRFPTVRSIADHLQSKGDDQAPSAASRGAARAAARLARRSRR